jgi:hypothetical protein
MKRQMKEILSNLDVHQDPNQICQQLSSCFQQDPILCETFVNLHSDKKALVELLKETVPSLYSLCRETSQPPAAFSSLKKEVSRNVLDASLKKDINSIIIAIAAIRDSPQFEDYFILFLIECATHGDSLVCSACSRAFESVVRNPRSCSLISSNFSANSTVIFALSQSLQFADRSEAETIFASLISKLELALQDTKTRFSAAQCLAAGISLFGEKYLEDVHSSFDRTIIQKLLISMKH